MVAYISLLVAGESHFFESGLHSKDMLAIAPYVGGRVVCGVCVEVHMLRLVPTIPVSFLKKKISFFFWIIR